MKRLVTLIVLVFTFTFVSAVSAHAQGCTNASLKGTYGFTEVGAPAWNVVGVLTFDGKGNLTYDWTITYSDGSVLSSVDPLTYSVSPNCRFTFTGGANYQGVIVLDGRELRWVLGVDGFVAKGEAHKLRTQQ